MNSVKIGLVTGRHDMPVSDYIFQDRIEFPIHPDALYKTAYLKFRELLDGEHPVNVNLYLTGLTSATLAALSAWDAALGIWGYEHVLNLWEWDMNEGKYVDTFTVRKASDQNEGICIY